jgi:hypothetical protein
MTSGVDMTLCHLAMATDLANRAGVKKIGPGWRVWRSAGGAGFFFDTPDGRAEVTVRVMHPEPGVEDRWKVVDDDEAVSVTRKRPAVYDTELVWGRCGR